LKTLRERMARTTSVSCGYFLEMPTIPSVGGGLVADNEHYIKIFDIPFIERLYHQIQPTIDAWHFSIGIF
jgi:hypothetical protein